MKPQLLIPAAGIGLRLGSSGPKALVDLAGKTMLAHTLERFASLGLVDGAIIVAPPGQLDTFEENMKSAFPGVGLLFVEGGAERQISVLNGIRKLKNDTDIVVIHDAARPFVPVESVRSAIAAAVAHGAATVALPCSDTILVSDEDRFLVDTPDRARLWSCQTPQVFQVSVIRRAHEAALADGFIGTDDASLVRRIGEKVKLVVGSSLNFKITAPADLELAACVVRSGLV